MTTIAVLTALAAATAAAGARAGEMVPNSDNSRPIKAVVELFTSQGCSSCPPADALLRTYASRKDIVALSFPVDYWDYLGWKDTLANHRNSERQRFYAVSLGSGSVYTPQVVINGALQAVGSKRADIDAAIESSGKTFLTKHVPVRFWRHESIYNIDLGPAAGGLEASQATVWFAVVQRHAEVQIPRGENGGKTLTYTNVVRDLVPVGVWEGQQKSLHLASSAVLRTDSEDQVVLVQDNKSGAIVGAAFLNN